MAADRSKENDPCRPELLLLEYDVDDLKGPNLPTNGDMLRYYFNRRRALPAESKRSIARTVVLKCIEIWKDNKIPTTTLGNGMKRLGKMLDEFNRAINSCQTTKNAQRREDVLYVWRLRCDLLFFVATRDAGEKCSYENRLALLAATNKIQEFNAAKANGAKRTNDGKAQRKPTRNKLADDAGGDSTSRKTSQKKSDSGTGSSENTEIKNNMDTKSRVLRASCLENAASQPIDSPNQHLREQLKKEGWIYKKNPKWKLAVVVPPPSMSFV